MLNPDNFSREKRQIELMMDFSHTEIQIQAWYLVSGEEVKVVANFLTTKLLTIDLLSFYHILGKYLVINF